MTGKILKDLLVRFFQCPKRKKFFRLRIQGDGEELFSLCAGQAFLQDILESERLVLVEGQEFPEGFPGELIIRGDIERVDPVDGRFVLSDDFSYFRKITFIHNVIPQYLISDAEFSCLNFTSIA